VKDPVADYSEAAIAQGSKSFAAAARLFDRKTRGDAVMLYAWCRHCDDVIDGQTLGHAAQTDYRTGQRDRLGALRAETARAAKGNEPVSASFEAMRRVVRRNEIPERYLQELLDGFEMDVAGRDYATINDTLDYCYGVAGVVGVMMSMIMGARDPAVLDRASDLGLAFQLTNIARDVIDDARMGRTYIPADILARNNVAGFDVEDRAQWPMLHAAALELLDIAEPYYESAAVGIGALPLRSAWAIAAARRVYRDIGSSLRKNGPAAWENRISTSRSRKLTLLAAAFADAVASRFANQVKSRSGLWQRP
jgi:15-cis-phytoene synthase